jgi:hypothetical protein
MKWNMLLGALVVSVGLCGQSFGFELLERMLGIGGYGCGCESACCEPACGCEAEPACGCEAAPACGCEAAPACGCESACCESSCCEKRCHGGCGLLDGLFGHHGHGCHKKSCCESSCCDAEPACGCEAAPACGCEAAPSCCESSCCKKRCHRHCGLLDGLFGHHGHGCHKRSCCASDCCASDCTSSCGCGGGNGGGAAIQSDEAAPVPPAPMADPSASLKSRRRVVHATSVVRRQ